MILWETDARAIARAVQAAAAAGELIDDGTARAIASGYNEPGIVGEFCSTGAISADAGTLFDAITDHGHRLRAAQESDRQALDALRAYLDGREECGQIGPVAGWSTRWVIRHVDYPHAGVGDLYDCPPCEAIRAETDDSPGQAPEPEGDPPARPGPEGLRPFERRPAGRVVMEMELTVTEHRTDRVRVSVELPAAVARSADALLAYLNQHPQAWLKALPAMADDIPVIRRTVDAADVLNQPRAIGLE